MTHHNNNTERQLSPRSSLEDFVQVEHFFPREGGAPVVQESTRTMAVDDEEDDDDNKSLPTTVQETRAAATRMTKKNTDITMDDILHVLLKAIKSVKGNIHFTMQELKSPEMMMEMVSSSSTVVQEGSNRTGDEKINKNVVDSPRPASDLMRPINILVTIQQEEDFVTRGEFEVGIALVAYVCAMSLLLPVWVNV